jgi:transcriptional regulator with XRE-family HTH domain
MSVEAPDRRPRSLDPEVAEALRLGPFHTALQLVIGSRGLTLARLEYHLANRGFRVGRSTLSYWQQGRRRPERPESMRALRALEDILDIPPDSLSSLLGPKRPRGRWIHYQPDGMSWADMWADNDDITRLVSIDSRRNNDRVHEISIMENILIGPDRRMQWLETNMVIQARDDGVNRHMILFSNDPDVDVTRIKATHLQNCRLGRHRVLADSYFVAFELIFDQTLNAGETFIFSYRLDLSDAFLTEAERIANGIELIESTEGVRAFRRPTHTYVLAAKFTPGVMPVRTYRVHAPRRGGIEQAVRELDLSAQGTTHIAVQNPPLGVHGIRWEWE